MHDAIESIVAAFEKRGTERYGDEEVSQLEHALQCASLAIAEGEDDEIVCAALLHDIGHILGASAMPASCEENLDDAHETRGHEFLVRAFGPRLADPVRLHVAAKRYLCSVEPEYVGRLSPTSLKSFEDQGGVMSPQERLAFESEPSFEVALRLRRWDDTAKDPDLRTHVLEHFLPMLDRVLRHA